MPVPRDRVLLLSMTLLAPLVGCGVAPLGDGAVAPVDGGGDVTGSPGSGSSVTPDPDPAAPPSADPQPSDPPPPDPVPSAPATEVHFQGRMDTRDPDGPRCAWTYCGLSTRVRGGGLDVVIGGAAGIRFQVVVDGAPTFDFETAAGQTTYRVADGLPAGDHDVAVVRASEPLFGDSQLFGFVPAPGAQLVPFTEATDRRLEVVGDSITAGYGNEGCPFGTGTQDGYRSYPAVAARALGADLHVEAWSGIGMVRDASGVMTGMMPERFERALPADASSRWDFSTWVPGVVVVNLGTNDFAGGNPGQPFVDAYVAFVRSLRARYPDALVLCASNGNASIGAALDAVVSALADPAVKRFDFAVPDWGGCYGHPSVSADQAMGAQLAARLEADLGW